MNALHVVASGDQLPAPSTQTDAVDAAPVKAAETVRVLSADPNSKAFIKDETRRLAVCVVVEEGSAKATLLWSPDQLSHSDGWFAQYRATLKSAGIDFVPQSADLMEIGRRYKSMVQTAHAAVSKSQGASARERAIYWLREGGRLRASDIRFILDGDYCYIRYRRNQRGYHLTTLPYEEGLAICNIIYGSFGTQIEGSGLDLTKKQDAALNPKIAAEEGFPEGRINTHPKDPIGHGLQMTIRLQPMGTTRTKSLEDLGFLDDQRGTFVEMLECREGAIVFSGPMGSGKSTALIALAELMSEMFDGTDIITIEDPIEYRSELPNIMPLPKQGTWEEEIMSMVRQAPDVLMPSEIRNSASAVNAIDMVSTGVMMMTTLHTNDVFTIPRRLMRLGVDKEMILDPQNLTGMVHMRLITRLCEHCKIPYAKAPAGYIGSGLQARLEAKLSAKELAGVYVENKDGCAICHEVEAGRIAVAEVVRPTLRQIKLLGGEYGPWRCRQDFVQGGGITKTAHMIEHIKNGVVCPKRAERDLWRLDKDEQLQGDL